MRVPLTRLREVHWHMYCCSAMCPQDLIESCQYGSIQEFIDKKRGLNVARRHCEYSVLRS
jgi:hypothetical protein